MKSLHKRIRTVNFCESGKHVACEKKFRIHHAIKWLLAFSLKVDAISSRDCLKSIKRTCRKHPTRNFATDV